MTAKILAFDGSGRAASMNRKVLDLVVADVKTIGGVTGTAIDLHAFNVPLYNEDEKKESGFPKGVLELKKLFREHDAYLIASPEYNGSFSPLLKNILDWVSRPLEGEKGLDDVRGKPVGMIAASPGKLGGLRGLYHLNTVLFSMGMLVLPEIVSIGNFGEAMDESGQLKNDNDKNAVNRLAKRIVQISTALKA